MTSNNDSQITELSSDLHWALNSVPLEGEYYSKLELYAQLLVEKYNWVKIHQYSTHELLNLLPVSTKIITSDDQIAVKHETGWVILSPEGYIFSRISTENLKLPAFSVPSTINQASEVDN